MPWIHLSLAAVAIAAAVPVAAQTRLPLPDHDAEAMIAGYADCVVARKGRQVAVADFLRAVPNTEASYRASLKAADLTCLNAAAARAKSVVQMRMQPASFRDALYPALYRRDFGGAAPAADLATLPPYDLKAEFAGDPAGLPADYALTRQLGDCIARTASAPTRAFLLATPWSDADTAAVDQLKPAIAACLAPGQTARFNRAALRAYVGEAAYKLARAAPGA